VTGIALSIDSGQARKELAKPSGYEFDGDGGSYIVHEFLSDSAAALSLLVVFQALIIR